MSSSSSASDVSGISISSDAESIRTELVDWFDGGDDATGIRFGKTRYIPLRVLVPLARAYFVREYDEDVFDCDVEDALRSMEDEGVSVETLRLVWDGQWTEEEFVTGVGFKNGGGSDAGWAEFVADIMEWADNEIYESDDDSSCVCCDCECDDSDVDDASSATPQPAPPRGLEARDIARFVGFQNSGFYVSEAAYMPLLDFQIAVLTAAKESGEFGDNPHLMPGETEKFAIANGFIICELTMPWGGVWKNADFIIGISQTA